jgi:hypothetical protein
MGVTVGGRASYYCIVHKYLDVLVVGKIDKYGAKNERQLRSLLRRPHFQK